MKLLHPPLSVQRFSYDCGPTCLHSLVNYWGIDVENDKIMKMCKTRPDLGTGYLPLMRVARELGLYAKSYHDMVIDDLKGFIDQGKPVIVSIQAWGKNYKDLKDGHFVVVIGYTKKRLFFEDPYIKEERRGYLSHEDFLKRWEDVDTTRKILYRYGLVIWKRSQPVNEQVVKKFRKIK